MSAIPADLGIPTSRRGLVKAKQVLQKWNRIELYDKIIEAVGASEMTKEDVVHQLGETTRAFDLAVDIAVPPIPLPSFLCRETRPGVVDGSRQMIKDGHFREVGGFLLFIRSICQIVIDKDAPEETALVIRKQYDKLLAKYSLASKKDREKREVDEIICRKF